MDSPIRSSWLTLEREELMRVFENKVPRRIFGTNREELTKEWRKCIMISFIICVLHQILL
jgi:hypothetical protein